MSLLSLLKKSLKKLTPAIIFCLSLVVNQAQAGTFYRFYFDCVDMKTDESIPVTLARTRLTSATILETQEILNIDTGRYKAPRALKIVISDFERPTPRLNRQEVTELMEKPLSREVIESKAQTLWLKVGDEEIPFDWATDAEDGGPAHPLKFGSRYRFFIANCGGGTLAWDPHYLAIVPPNTDVYGLYITIERY